jgi:hypothetical protein
MPELSTESTDQATATRRARLSLRPKMPVVAGVVIATLGLLFGGIATASANGSDHHGSSHGGNPYVGPAPTPAFTPTRVDQIPNVTLVENAIKAYYGDTVAANGDHVPSTTGNYAKEVSKIEASAQWYLKSYHSHSKAQKAIVLDVDDTSLNTYNYEIFSGFAYNPTTNAEYVNDARFPEVYGMPALAKYASDHGYQVFFITGRPEAQRTGTVTNLSKVGFTAPAVDHLFLKNNAAPPAYLDCGATCTTIQYKSETRAHIESLGYKIVANFGDQYSDLTGGYSQATFKMPNPMYYLP